MDETLPPARLAPQPAAGPPPEDEGEAHDRGLIIERLAWSVEQRLDANAAFLRFYGAVRPQGPLLRGE